MRSKVFEHLEAINYTKDRVSFSADVMELWLDNGQAIRVDLSLPAHEIEQRSALARPGGQIGPRTVTTPAKGGK